MSSPAYLAPRAKTLVTGGSGHFGANLVRRLLDEGHDVRALVQANADNRGLDFPRPDGHGYAVFGKVVSGMDTVDKIKGTKTGPCAPHFAKDCPQTQVVIKSAKRVGKK